MSDKQDQLEGTGGDSQVTAPLRSVYKQISKQQFLKDQKLNIFKHRVNHFFIQIIRQYMHIQTPEMQRELAKLAAVQVDIRMMVDELRDI